MKITAFTLVFTLICVNVFLIAFVCLNNCLYKKILSVGFFVEIFICMCLRIIFPVEIVGAITIRSYSFYPKILNIITFNVLSFLPWVNASIQIKLYQIPLLVLSFISIKKLILLIRQYFIAYKSYSKYTPTDDDRVIGLLNAIKQENGYKFKVKVLMHEDILHSAEFGFFKQTIILPVDYGDRKLYAVLQHELRHFKTKASWIKLIANVIQCIFWWNPIGKHFLASVEQFTEILADKYVIKDMNYDDKGSYMMYMASRTEGNDDGISRTVSFFEPSSKTLVDNRVAYIMKEKNHSKIINRLAMIGVVLIFILSYSIVPQPYIDLDDEELSSSYIKSESNPPISFENGKYIVHYDSETTLVYNSMDDIPDKYKNLPIDE